jgi:hypothetical protein
MATPRAAANHYVVDWNKTHLMRLTSFGLGLRAERAWAAFTLLANRSCVSMIAPSLSPVVGLHFVSICCRPGGRQMLRIFHRQLLIFE